MLKDIIHLQGDWPVFLDGTLVHFSTHTVGFQFYHTMCLIIHATESFKKYFKEYIPQTTVFNVQICFLDIINPSLDFVLSGLEM